MAGVPLHRVGGDPGAYATNTARKDLGYSRCLFPPLQ